MGAAMAPATDVEEAGIPRFTIAIERAVDYKGEKYGETIVYKIKGFDGKVICSTHSAVWAERIVKGLQLVVPQVP